MYFVIHEKTKLSQKRVRLCHENSSKAINKRLGRIGPLGSILPSNICMIKLMYEMESQVEKLYVKRQVWSPK